MARGQIMNIMIGTRVGVYHADILDTFFDRLYNTVCDHNLYHALVIDSGEAKNKLDEIDFEYPTTVQDIDNPHIDKLRNGKVYGQNWHHVISTRLHNYIREVFLKTKADRCLFLDSDIMIEEDTIQELIDYDKDIISANFMLPNGEQSSAFKELIPNSNGASVVHYSLGEIDDLTKVEGLGTSALLVKRKVLEDIEFKNDRNIGAYPDVRFSIDAQEKGYDMWVAGNTEVGHLWKDDLYYPGDRVG